MLATDIEKFNLAISLAQSGQREEARVIIVQLLRTDPNEPNLLLWLAFTSGKIEQARLALSKVRVIDPTNPSLPSAESWLAEQEAQQKANLNSTTLPTIPTAIKSNQPESFRVSDRNANYQAETADEIYQLPTLHPQQPPQEVAYQQESSGYLSKIAEGWQSLKQALHMTRHKPNSQQ
jgi:tetratricopeptide (TPR) repeat protein